MNKVHNQTINLDSFVKAPYTLSIKREDLIHPFISGNKYRKLKYNLLEAKEKKHDTLLTFGGAFSNHIAAVAYAGKLNSLKTIGLIRGIELEKKIASNPTLTFAKKCGMSFEFISREEYRKKDDPSFITKLKQNYGPVYILPEGGTNNLAVKGCEEILLESDSEFDYICTAVGTGGTITGLINASYTHQTVFGFSVLKGTFQIEDIKKYTSKSNYKIIDDYCLGGYAKIDEEFIRFINEFKANTQISLDPVYTGKMIYGIFDLIKN